MLRVKPFLAAALVAALVIALPATASASEWLKNGAPLKNGSHVTIPVEGLLSRYPGFIQGGQELCRVKAEILLEPKKEAPYEAITKFAVNPKECEGTGSYAGVCQVESFSSSVPWPIHIEEVASKPAIVANETSLQMKFAPGTCPGWPGWSFSGPLVLTPDNPASISTVNLYGQDPIHPGPTINGSSWAVSPSGVYGIKL